jgi:cold shock CspA family protein
MPDPTATGTIIKLVKDKGFGFIKGSDGNEYFFHRSSTDIFEQLQEGESVRFVPTHPPKGPRAESVQGV